MLEFVDEPESLASDWAGWAAGHERSPVWLAAVNLSDSVERVVGTFVTPAAVVLGIRAWDDADEGVEPAPYALFDVEKLVRMSLHQSGLAFEALCSPKTFGSTFPAREIAAAAVTSGVLDYYRDVTAALQTGSREQWRWRTLLTGALLAQAGIVSHRLPTLATRLGVSETFDANAIADLRASLNASSLPAAPTDYAYLNDFVVQARLGST